MHTWDQTDSRYIVALMRTFGYWSPGMHRLYEPDNDLTLSPCPSRKQLLRILPEITRNPINYLVYSFCCKIIYNHHPYEMLTIIALEANQGIYCYLGNSLEMQVIALLELMQRISVDRTCIGWKTSTMLLLPTICCPADILEWACMIYTQLSCSSHVLHKYRSCFVLKRNLPLPRYDDFHKIRCHLIAFVLWMLDRKFGDCSSC
jgi:hypothetical protein